MGKVGDIAHHQTSFASGILSAELAGRIDLAKYDSGIKHLENFIIHPEGGISNRTGLKMLCQMNNEPSMLLPFIFNNSQSYIVVLTHNKVRFITRNEDEWGFVHTIHNTIYELATRISHEFFKTLECVQSHDVLMMTAHNMPPVKLMRLAHDRWTFEYFNFSSSFAKVSNVTHSFIGTGLDANEITLSYCVAAIDNKGDLGQVSDPKVITVKALWPNGTSVKLSWDKMPNANGYMVYKSIEGRGLGYIGRSIGTTFLDDYITPDYTRSPERKAVSIIYSKFQEFSGAIFSLSMEARYPANYQNMNQIKLDSIIEQASADSGSIYMHLKKTNVFEFICSKRIRIRGLTFYGSSDKALFSGFGSSFYGKISIRTGLELSPLSYYIDKNMNNIKSIHLAYSEGSAYTLNIGEKFLIELEVRTPTSNAMMWISAIKFDYDELPDNPEDEKVGFLNSEYPGNITIHNQRLIFSNTKSYPVGLFASRTGLLYDFTVGDPMRDDDAIEANLSALRNDRIHSMVSMEELFLFTENGEYMVIGGNNSPISPTNLIIKQISNYGSTRLNPLIIGQDILFVARDGRSVRVLRFNEKGVGSSSLNVLCKNIFKGRTIIKWCYASDPDSMVWCLFNDGTVATLTYLAEQEVWAWSLQSMTGKVIDIVSLPSEDRDMIFMLIERGGKFVFERLTYRDENIFHDSEVNIISDKPTKIFNVPHSFFHNQIISVYVSGDTYRLPCDTQGDIRLPQEAQSISVGLPYDCSMETLRVESRNTESLQGRKKRIVSIDLLLEKSRGNLLIQSLNDDLSSKDTTLKTYIDHTLNLLPLEMSGYVRVALQSVWTHEGRLRIIHKDAVSLTILGLIKHIEVGDR